MVASNKQLTDAKKRHLSDVIDDDMDVEPTSTKPKKGRQKKGPKRSKTFSDSTMSQHFEVIGIDSPAVAVPSRKPKDFSVQEISPFEAVLTYKCQFCTKRSQDVKRIEDHLREEHPGRDQAESGFKILSRDQVVDSLTKFVAGRNGDQNNQFACYYCEVNSYFHTHHFIYQIFTVFY